MDLCRVTKERLAVSVIVLSHEDHYFCACLAGQVVPKVRAEMRHTLRVVADPAKCATIRTSVVELGQSGRRPDRPRRTDLAPPCVPMRSHERGITWAALCANSAPAGSSARSRTRQQCDQLRPSCSQGQAPGRRSLQSSQVSHPSRFATALKSVSVRCGRSRCNVSGCCR